MAQPLSRLRLPLLVLACPPPEPAQPPLPLAALHLPAEGSLSSPTSSAGSTTYRQYVCIDKDALSVS